MEKTARDRRLLQLFKEGQEIRESSGNYIDDERRRVSFYDLADVLHLIDGRDLVKASYTQVFVHKLNSMTKAAGLPPGKIANNIARKIYYKFFKDIEPPIDCVVVLDTKVKNEGTKWLSEEYSIENWEISHRLQAYRVNEQHSDNIRYL